MCLPDFRIPRLDSDLTEILLLILHHTITNSTNPLPHSPKKSPTIHHLFRGDFDLFEKCVVVYAFLGRKSMVLGNSTNDTSAQNQHEWHSYLQDGLHPCLIVLLVATSYPLLILLYYGTIP